MGEAKSMFRWFNRPSSERSVVELLTTKESVDIYLNTGKTVNMRIDQLISEICNFP
jgi:hypothetical protein